MEKMLVIQFHSLEKMLILQFHTWYGKNARLAILINLLLLYEIV